MDLFNSLENLLPHYETVLPFSKEKVSFTPFRVKDAKNISIILQLFAILFPIIFLIFPTFFSIQLFYVSMNVTLFFAQ